MDRAFPSPLAANTAKTKGHNRISKDCLKYLNRKEDSAEGHRVSHPVWRTLALSL